MAFEQEQARENMAFEQQAEAERLRQQEHSSARDADRRDRETEGKLSKNRPGGKLDE
jgi:hypothetical protein